MKKYSYLLKNIGLLALSSFGTKVLSFLLIPLYTSVLSTSDVGIYDNYTTTVTLMLSVLTMNVSEAVMRFTLDPNKEKSSVFSIGVRRICLAAVIFSLLVLINKTFDLIPLFNQYAVFLLLYFVGSLLYDFLSQFSRGVDKISYVAIAGAMNSVIMLSTNILFLLYFKMGLVGYFLAHCLALYIPALFLFIRLKAWQYWRKEKTPELKQEMNSYSRPLVLNSTAWWINNVSDRYIVTWICGTAANGIYSVAYKIPSILNIFQNIFSQAWTLSAVKEYDDKENDFYSVIYRWYNCGMVLVCSGLLIGNKLMAHILFKKEFFMAWQYAPFLMISVVFGSLSGMLGGVFSASKTSKTLATSTAIGAAINTVLNLLLVHLIGPLGAAIATLAAYVVVWAYRLVKARKLVRIDVKIMRDTAAYAILLFQALVYFISEKFLILYGLEAVGLIAIFVLFRKEAIEIITKLLSKVRGRKNARTD